MRSEVTPPAGEPERFDGEIKVASRIVDFISSGLYRDPAACLKELINNAYDADATKVNLFVKPDADRIVIEDNGSGMSKDDFVRHFDRVSESHKRDQSDKTELGRPKIGKIGIGFVAANEMCDLMEIVSTKEGSRDLLRVTINFAEMRKDISERRRKGDGSGVDIAKGDYEGVVDKTGAAVDEHYTWLFLSRIRGHTKSVLASAKRQFSDASPLSLYGCKPESATKVLTSPALDSWSQLDAYSETMVKVGLNIPVAYLPGWIRSPWHSTVRSFEKEVEALRFSVVMDGSDLRKPVAFRTPERAVCEEFRYEGEHVGARGYFYAQRYQMRPQELKGLLVRVRHAAVGEYDPSFWNFPPDEAPLLQSWCSAEVWADDRLEDAVNIDRRTLRAQHDAYVELQQAVHDFLRGFFKRVRQELYAAPATARRHTRAESEIQKIAAVVEASGRKLTPEIQRDLRTQWRGSADSASRTRDLLRTYTVSQLYALVLEVANEVLSPEQAERFLRALSQRLSR